MLDGAYSTDPEETEGVERDVARHGGSHCRCHAGAGTKSAGVCADREVDAVESLRREI